MRKDRLKKLIVRHVNGKLLIVKAKVRATLQICSFDCKCRFMGISFDSNAFHESARVSLFLT